jgi:MFS family permease
MSFKRFIYFCMICGGWAAFVVWGLAEILNLFEVDPEHPAMGFVKAAATGARLGLFAAAIIGALDAMMNAVGFARLVRIGVCLSVGLVGGAVGAVVGQALFSVIKSPITQTVGWAIVGIAVGASIGVFDILRAVLTKAPLRQSLLKMINGVIGGTVGGVLGGIALAGLTIAFGMVFTNAGQMHSPRALGLVILGMCIGLLIGTAQVVLKEAWVKVEAGFRPGREVMLTKPETTVGRAEGVDIAMFGDKDCEKLHSKVVLKSGRYYLVDNGTPGGTFLNGDRISGPSPLKSGDLIQCGRSTLRFGERAKRT